MRRNEVIVVGSGWAFTSGISYYTCRLANALAEHRTTGIVPMRNLIPTRLYPGRDRVGRTTSTLRYADVVQVHEGVDWWGRGLLTAVLMVARSRPRVVVFQWWTAAVLHSYLPLAFVARLVGAKVILELHEIQDTGEMRVPLASAYSRLGMRGLLHAAAGGIVHSRFDAAAVEHAFPANGLTWRVVPHGPYDHVVRRPADREDDRLHVLFFGTVRPYKGVEHLVESLSFLPPDEVTDVELAVIGETWEGWTRPDELLATVPRPDLVTRVDGYVSDDDVERWYSWADVVVLPYLRSSASGPLHIAMSCGLPVVVTAVGGLVEVAEGYDLATTVPPADPEAISRALRAALQRHRRGEPARLAVTGPGWALAVTAIEELGGLR